MDFKKTVLTLLAIFCVIASAGVVCAEDASGSDGYLQGEYQDGYAGSQYDGGYAGSQYDGGYAGSQYQDEGGWAGSQYNETAENAALNQTGNATQNVTAANTVSPVAEANNTTPAHTLPATGNPIVLLLGVSALAGGYAVLRRKN